LRGEKLVIVCVCVGCFTFELSLSLSPDVLAKAYIGANVVETVVEAGASFARGDTVLGENEDISLGCECCRFCEIRISESDPTSTDKTIQQPGASIATPP
jgi:hypothetical protein